MNEVAIERNAFSVLSGRKALQISVAFWFVTAAIGQWIFSIYLILFYGGTAVRGEMHEWNEKLTHGYAPGDTVGNAAVIAHLSLAVIVMTLGTLQLIPQIRASFPVFHRWSGRIYLFAVTIVSIAGMYMLLVHGTVGGTLLVVAQGLDAILILMFAPLALIAAIKRDFKAHRRWALRLFMVVSAVWFFRVGLMFWFVVNQGPVGIDLDTFTGPFVTFIAFAQYFVPLLVLECYFRAQESSNAKIKYVMGAVITVLALAMALGIFGAVMGLWLPHI